MTKVLVIDDEQMIRWSIEQTLRAAGCDVAVAETAAEGMALFRKLQPDLVFLDIRLPDEDGFTLLKRIKDESGLATAVIMMTAFDESRTATEAIRLGASAYLKKPFDFDALEAISLRALEANQAQPDVAPWATRSRGAARIIR